MPAVPFTQHISQNARRVPEWLVYTLGVIPFFWIFWLCLDGRLGPEPVKELEHRLGLLGLQFLLASLMITPLMRYGRINLIKFRRTLGLLGFTYVLLHFLTWMILDLALRWDEIGADLVKRPYIVVGFVAFLLLIPLVATSWQGAIRRIGPKAWGRLHRLSYVVVILGAVHFVMQEKVWERESLLYLYLALGLVAMRVLWVKRL